MNSSNNAEQQQQQPTSGRVSCRGRSHASRIWTVHADSMGSASDGGATKTYEFNNCPNLAATTRLYGCFDESALLIQITLLVLTFWVICFTILLVAVLSSRQLKRCRLRLVEWLRLATITELRSRSFSWTTADAAECALCLEPFAYGQQVGVVLVASAT